MTPSSKHHPPKALRALPTLCLTALLLSPLWGCTPTLDWRDLRLPNTELRMQWPCKPHAMERTLALEGQVVHLRMHVCEAGGIQWAVADTQVNDPGIVDATLHALLNTWLTPLTPSNAPIHLTPADIPGMTPFAQAQRARSSAVVLPDGSTAWIDAVSFAHGTRVFRATALGHDHTAASMAQTYFSSLTLKH